MKRLVLALTTLLPIGACGNVVEDQSLTETVPGPTSEASEPVGTSTTTLPSVVSPDGAATTTATTSLPPAFPYWSVTCSERLGSGDHQTSVASTFTAVGAAPSLDLGLPAVMTSGGEAGAIAATVVIPGGVLVTVLPPSGWSTPDEVLSSSSLVAVDHDGEIRWRRCFDESGTVVVGSPDAGPEVAWVFSSAWDRPLEVRGIDLSNGSDVQFPVDVSGFGLRGVGERFVVLGASNDSPVIADGSPLLVVNTLDGSTTNIVYPAETVGTHPLDVWFTVIDSGRSSDEPVVVANTPSGDGRVVWSAGGWSSDPQVLGSLLPATLQESFGEPYELRLLDGAGSVVWSSPDFHGIAREGFRSAIADSVAVAVRCSEWDAEGICGWQGDRPPAEEVVGFDLATGEELWVSPGARAFPVIAGDLAIATRADSGYELIDLRTGTPLGPTWPEGSFTEECCGAEEYVHVERHGGVVIATDEGQVRVWYPAASTVPTVSVDLMG